MYHIKNAPRRQQVQERERELQRQAELEAAYNGTNLDYHHIREHYIDDATNMSVDFHKFYRIQQQSDDPTHLPT